MVSGTRDNPPHRDIFTKRLYEYFRLYKVSPPIRDSERPGYIFDKMADRRKVAINVTFLLSSLTTALLMVVDGC